MKVSLSKAVELLGYKVIKKDKGYNFRTVWAEKEGQLYYWHIEDLRDSEPSIFYRTVESLKDYRGGANHFVHNDELAEQGFTIFEPRKKCDYNSL